MGGDSMYFSEKRYMLYTNDHLYRYVLQPFLPLEVDNHDNSNNYHGGPSRHVTPVPVKLRHIKRAFFGIEVHAVYPSNECEGNEYGGYDRQDLHHLVHPVADAR